MALGSVLYAAGAGQKIDEVFADKVPAFHKLLNHRARIWDQTEKGLLAGVVVSKTEQELKIIDSKGQTWTVNITEIRTTPKIEARINRPIRIIGEQIDTNAFKAQRILIKRPLSFPGKPRVLKLPFKNKISETPSFPKFRDTEIIFF